MGSCCGGPETEPVTTLAKKPAAKPVSYAPPVKKVEPIKLYGDVFDGDTRTLKALMEMAGLQFDFKPLNTFDREHTQEAYLKICPIGAVPLMTDARFKMMGSLSNFLAYLGSK